MARKRMLDPGIWTDDGFLSLSCQERLLFIGLISHADDDGRGSAAPRSLRAKVFPGDSLSDEQITAMCERLSGVMRASFYSVDGTHYYQLDRWDQHQFIKDRRPSTLPPPDAGPGADRERTGSGPGAVPNEFNESMNERNECPDRSLPASSPDPEPDFGDAEPPAPPRPTAAALPPHQLVACAWYRRYTQETGKPISPDEQDFLGALKACGRMSRETLEGAIGPYFNEAWWFTKDKRTGKRTLSFGSFLAHVEEILSTAPAKPKARGRECPHCHALNTHTGGVCMHCHEDMVNLNPDQPEPRAERLPEANG